MSRPRIRDADLHDLPALRAVFRAASLWNDHDREALLAHPEHLELDVAEAIADRRVRVAIVDGAVAGFATTAVEGDVAELEDLFVHPDLMRRGIATELVADSSVRARAAGASTMTVVANPQAAAFYASVGFVGAHAVDTELGPALGLSMRLDDG